MSFAQRLSGFSAAFHSFPSSAIAEFLFVYSVCFVVLF
jgi:hypothetical protein